VCIVIKESPKIKAVGTRRIASGLNSRVYLCQRATDLIGHREGWRPRSMNSWPTKGSYMTPMLSRLASGSLPSIDSVSMKTS